MITYSRILGLWWVLVTATVLRAAEDPAPGFDLRGVLAAAIIESDGNFDDRTGKMLKETEQAIFYAAARPVQGLPGEQGIMQVDGVCCLTSKLTDPAAVRSVHDAVVSLPAYTHGFGLYKVTQDSPGSGSDSRVTKVSLNGHPVICLTESPSGKEWELKIGAIEGRPPPDPDAWKLPAPERSISDLHDLLLKMIAASPQNFPAVERLRRAVVMPDREVFVASAVEGMPGSSHVMYIPSTGQSYYSAVITDPAQLQQMTEAMKSMPRRFGPAWKSEQKGPKLEISREGKALIDLTVNSLGNGILQIGQFLDSDPGLYEVYVDLDRLIAEGVRGFEGLTSQPLTRTTATIAHPVAPLLHANKMEAFSADDSYPFLTASWAEGNADTDPTFRSMRLYVAEGMAKGTMVVESNTAMAHIYPDSRLIRFTQNEVSVIINYRLSRTGPRMTMEVMRNSHPPWYKPKPTMPDYSTTTTSAPSRSTQTRAPQASTMQHTCVRCDGRGAIETTDRYGAHVRTTCPVCGGKGYYTN